MRLATRLALVFGAVVIAATALIGALSYAAIMASITDSIDESLLAAGAPMAHDVSDDDLPDAPEDPSSGADTGIDLPSQVLLPNGRTIALTPGDLALPVDAQDLALARSDTPGARYRNATIDSRPYRMLTLTEGGAHGAVQVGRDISEDVAVLASLTRQLTLIAVLVAALAAVAGWLLARRISRRLVALTEAAEGVAMTGRLDAAVPTGGSDEIARLSASFSAMLAQLAESREDQSRLVQDAGHELRTPLTSLRTNVSLLRQFDAMSPQTRDRVIADLDGETRELTALVNEVMHLSAATPPDSPDVPVRLAALAHSVAGRAYRRTGRQVSVAADGSVALGQPAALERAIWNLVDNACKFSPETTAIELIVDRGTVLVRDRGPGIDPGDLPAVFDRFHRATAARSLPGSGLGLAIVRDVAAAHGGQVFAANRPDGGAELGFTVPVEVDSGHRSGR